MNENSRFPEREHGKKVVKPVNDKKYLYFTAHALKRMKSRGIGQQEVINALEKPDETGLKTPNFRGRSRNRWNRSAKTAIDVVFEDRGDHYRIISAIDVIRDDTTGVESKTKNKRKPRQRKPRKGGRRRR